MSEYKIKEGKHYHSNILQHFMFWPKKFKESSYKITFDPNCWYTKEDIPGIKDDNDRNKLHGVRYWNDHINSGAFVWLPNWNIPGIMDIFLYGYEKKKRYMPKEPITSILCGEPFVCGVKIGTYKGSKAYYFNIDGSVWCWVHKKPDAWFRRQPYFGGDPKAPWDMFIYMEKIDLGDWAKEENVTEERAIYTN